MTLGSAKVSIFGVAFMIVQFQHLIKTNCINWLTINEGNLFT